MLVFVGLGLHDERSITIEGRDVVGDADRVFAEFYTSKLAGASLAELEAYHDTTIERRDRAGVEQDPGAILEAAADGTAVFCTAGDPMVSTTHVDLRLRAHDRGIDTRVVHGTTAQAAASSLTGLQNYRFGKATTLPFERSHGASGVPGSVVTTIEDNRERGLHTLVYLDIKAEEDAFMTADRAAALLSTELPDCLGVAVCQAGSPEPTVVGARLASLADREFGPPLHMLVVPGDLHPVERDALVALADTPRDALETGA